jgi:hypothetical protein
MKKSTIALAVAAIAVVGVGVYMYFKSKQGIISGGGKAGGSAEIPGGGSISGGIEGGGSADAGRVIGGLRDALGKVQDRVKVPERPTVPDPPGFSPDNPVPSFDITPGFEGYILVEKNDSLGAISKRLGMAWGGWRDIRNRPENKWLRAFCPAGSKCSKLYFNGETGIALYARYGRTPGVDCSSPGWGPTYGRKAYHSINTGQFPVIFWKVGA